MTPTIESKLDVLAIGYDHYRIMRDNAWRALDYLQRLIKRGGKYFENDWWFAFPEPTHCLTLEDLEAVLKELHKDLEQRFQHTKEEATKTVKESNLTFTSSIDELLYNLAQKQNREKKANKKDLNKGSEEAIEEGILESLRKLPDLGPDRSYQYEGKENGRPKWSVIDTPKKSSPVIPKTKTKTIFKLNRRPKNEVH
jgi:hypothetical protein